MQIKDFRHHPIQDLNNDRNIGSTTEIYK